MLNAAPIDSTYCRNCKKLIAPEAAFCRFCGRDQRQAGLVGASQPPEGGLGLSKASKPYTALQVAGIAAIVLMAPVIVFCVYRHPFGCLFALILLVLPLGVLFRGYFRRAPVVLVAIACCLCASCTHVLNRFDARREAARAARSAQAESPGIVRPEGARHRRGFLRRFLRKNFGSAPTAPGMPGGEDAP